MYEERNTLIIHPHLDYVPGVKPGHELEAAVRESLLHSMLGTDYDYAVDSGLVDIFYYDPDTQTDGLLHVLTGEPKWGEGNAKVVEGYHHEPSANYLWAEKVDKSSANINQSTSTYVDRDHLEGKNSKYRREFAEHPFEPYRARTVVDNKRKFSMRPNPATGEKELAESNNYMFPKEYDPLTVMQSIKQAKENRDRNQDNILLDAGKIVCVSEAPLLDGEHKMRIRLILDSTTERVLAAYPLINHPGTMKLGKQAVQEHLGLQ